MRTQLRIVRDFSAAAGITGVSSAAQQVGAAIRALAGPSDGPAVSLPGSAAPPTPWNRSITAHRRFAMRPAKVSDLKRLKAVTGGTLNDVVMAIVAGALRAYLTEHDALPDRPLRAMVPVSIRTGDEEEMWTNRVSGLVVDLPTHLADPMERLAACREAMDRGKKQFELVPAEALVDIQQYSSPVVATSAIRMAARLKLADRMAPPVNVIISNVPGPRQPLYLDGAQMRTYIPVSTISEGMGLNVTVHSYLDELEFGLIACRELVPDLWHMVDLHIDEIDVLFAAAGVSRNGDAPAPAAKKAPAKRTPKKTAAKRAPTKAATKKAPAKKTAAKKAPAKKAPAKNAAAKSTVAKKAPAKRAPPEDSGEEGGRDALIHGPVLQFRPDQAGTEGQNGSVATVTAPRWHRPGHAARRVDHRGTRRRERRTWAVGRRVGPDAGGGVRHLRHRPPPPRRADPGAARHGARPRVRRHAARRAGRHTRCPLRRLADGRVRHVRALRGG